VERHTTVQLFEALFTVSLVLRAPPNVVATQVFLYEIFVARRASGEAAGAHNERSTVGEHTLMAAECRLV
jgi:hypothetical protein